jgi:hypothetical protein
MQFSLEFLNFCYTDFYNHPSLIRPGFSQAGDIEPFADIEYDEFREKLKRLRDKLMDVFEKYPNRNAIANSYVAKLLTNAYVPLVYPDKAFNLKVTMQAIREDLFSEQTVLLAREIVEDDYFSQVLEIADLRKIKILTDPESEPELDFSLINRDTVRADDRPPPFAALSPFASIRFSCARLHLSMENEKMHTPPGSPKSPSPAGSDSDQEPEFAPPPKDPMASVQRTGNQSSSPKSGSRFSSLTPPSSRPNSVATEPPSAPPTRPTSSSR